mmetsp:Transcript_72479/g.212415  ORF Transcript_72479/g.212415 Transcript_72479/m.212415 type:complete len:258 (-) Transcript_72479:111-884(-)
MTGGRKLELTVVPPSAIGQEGAVATKNLSIGQFSQVAALRQSVGELFGYGKPAAQDLVLYFQNESGPYSHRLKVLSDDCNLQENKMTSGATIVCQIGVQEKLKSKGGESLYYMWAVNLPEVPEEQRITDREGVPKLLGQDKQVPEAAALPVRKMSSYSWVDDSRKLVKIYITSAEDPLAIAAAGLQQEGLVSAEFGQQSLKIKVLGKSATHVLEIEELEHGIVPAECKVKVTAGKKISITLRKAKDDQLWHTLLPRK